MDCSRIDSDEPDISSSLFVVQSSYPTVIAHITAESYLHNTINMLIFIISFILASLISPLVIYWYRANRWLDDPEQRHAKKTHSVAVPRGGGLVVALTVLLVSALFLHWDSYLVAIMVGMMLLTVTGFLDDVFDIHPILRLAIGTLAALIVVGSGIGIAYISNPFTEGVIHLNQPQIAVDFLGETRTIWILADLFAVFFIVWNMNIVNWSKGVDGQMPGFVSIALIFVGLLSSKFLDDPTQFNTAYLAFGAAGAYAGLLVWNWYPQKIMPGYGGGSLAGYLLAILAILSGAKVATALMVLGVPTADALFTIARRLKAGKSPFWGDRGHMHHKLLDVFHWSKQQVALFYWICSLVLGVLSLYLNTVQKLFTIVAVVLVVSFVLIYAKYQTIRRSQSKHQRT